MPVWSTLPQAYFVNGDTGLKQTTGASWDNVYITAEELACFVVIPDSVADDADYDILTEVKPGIVSAIGKAFDQAAPIGAIRPLATTGLLTRGAITLTVNGQPRQKGDLSELIWNVAETISTLSKAWLLQPGDLIYTGTPAGVGAVVSGDVMEGAIDGLGTLRVKVR